MRFDKRRNLIAGVAAAIIFLAVIYTYGAAKGAEPVGKGVYANEEYGGILRFHVIANSDSDYDREMKLAVRDRVLEEMNKKLTAEAVKNYDESDGTSGGGITADAQTAKLNIDEVKELINDNLGEIEKIAEDVIKEYGSDYDARAELGVRFIPKKTYGDVTFPAGNYEALNITIGEGAGENWWCVLFPPLCLIDPTGETLDGIETDGIGEGTSEIKLKFKTKEIIEQLV